MTSGYFLRKKTLLQSTSTNNTTIHVGNQVSNYGVLTTSGSGFSSPFESFPFLPSFSCKK